MRIVIGFLLYHPINMGKCKKCMQTEPSKNSFPSFSLRFSEILKQPFLPQGEKLVHPVRARMGPFYIFGSNFMSYARAV